MSEQTLSLLVSGVVIAVAVIATAFGGLALVLTRVVNPLLSKNAELAIKLGEAAAPDIFERTVAAIENLRRAVAAAGSVADAVLPSGVKLDNAAVAALLEQIKALEAAIQESRAIAKPDAAKPAEGA